MPVDVSLDSVAALGANRTFLHAGLSLSSGVSSVVAEGFGVRPPQAAITKIAPMADARL
jgi:hypothetical protein